MNHKYIQTLASFVLLAALMVSCVGKTTSKEELDSLRKAKKQQYWNQKLLLVQRDLERTDSMLHSPTVDITKVDSLKERFDMLCMQVRFIHKKQSSLSSVSSQDK